MISHVTVTCHIEEYKRFWNSDVIQYVLHILTKLVYMIVLKKSLPTSMNTIREELGSKMQLGCCDRKLWVNRSKKIVFVEARNQI